MCVVTPALASTMVSWPATGVLDSSRDQSGGDSSTGIWIFRRVRLMHMIADVMLVMELVLLTKLTETSVKLADSRNVFRWG